MVNLTVVVTVTWTWTWTCGKGAFGPTGLNQSRSSSRVNKVTN